MRKAKTEQNIYREVTDLIKGKISSVGCAWKRDYPCLWPVNWITKENYSGINYLLLTEDSECINVVTDRTRNYIVCPYYATSEQIKNSGGRLKEGAESKKIISFLPVENSEKKELDCNTRLEYCEVYNMMNTEGVKDFNYAKWANMPEPKYSSNDEFMKGYKTVLNICEPEEDTMNYIGRVSMTDFDIDEFVCKAFMILIHATGKPGRLNRFEKLDIGSYGNPRGKEEELIGEIGTAMLCDYLGLCSWITEISFGYLQGWKKVLDEDEQLIFRACAKAQEAVNYILDI